MTKITFLVPPSLDNNKPAERSAGCTRVVYPMPNIYELIVVALLEQEGYDVAYKDLAFKEESKDNFIQFLSEDNSDIYCIWTVNLSLDTDLETMSIIRSIHPLAKIILMGPGVTYYSKELLIDDLSFVVRGEPDYTVVDLVKRLVNSESLLDCLGISFRNGGKVKHNAPRPLVANLDELPFPARQHIKDKRYINPKLKVAPYTTVLTSRNCPYKCIYCVPSSLTFAREIEHKAHTGKKPPISYRSIPNILEELDLLASQGYKSIAIIDDNFITTSKRLLPIVDKLKEHGFLWGCQARVDAIDEETAKILSNSGCCFIDLGVESFDDDILNYIKKGLTSQQIEDGIALLNKYKIPVKLNILIGTSPLETRKTIRHTLKKVKKSGVSQVMYNIVAPFPGTEFYDLAKENNWIVGGDYKPTDVQRDSILSYPQLSAKEMTRLLFWNNVRFFLRPSFIWKHITQFSSFYEFRMALRALKTKLIG